jgi:biopolymer transport protein ExbD
MSEITSDSCKRIKTNANKVNHRSTRIDLTPMVDLGFLLITFFVFTSSLSAPKAMAMIETHDGKSKPVKQSGAMSIILTGNHEIYYYYGQLETSKAKKQILKTNFQRIRNLILEKKKKTDPAFLMYLIKVDKQASFGDLIDLLDEMQICDIPVGHYAEVELAEAELLEITN